MRFTTKLALALVAGVLVVQTVFGVIRVRREWALFDLVSNRQELDEAAYLRESVQNAALAALLLVVACCGVAIVLTVAHERAAAERLAAAELQRRTERLQAAAHAMTAVAHELGTPLNVVAGHAQLISEDGEVSDDARANANVIKVQVARMAATIRQLLDHAHNDPNEPVGPGRTSVYAVARRALELTLPLAVRRQVTVHLRDGDGELYTSLSEAELTQMLVDFVIQGIQATPRGGYLALAVRRPESVPDDGLCDGGANVIELIVDADGDLRAAQLLTAGDSVAEDLLSGGRSSYVDWPDASRMSSGRAMPRAARIRA